MFSCDFCPYRGCDLNIAAPPPVGNQWNCYGYPCCAYYPCPAADFIDWNSEKRKEKSRDAARCRRSRETEIFTDLAQALPISQSACAQLDKASVMRLAISYLKVRSVFELVPDADQKKLPKCHMNDSLFLKALEGFLMVVSGDGELVFLSENVNQYLGLTQIDMMGHSIYDYSHPCDHEEITEILSTKSVSLPSVPRSFFIRLKCTLTSKGRNVNVKSASYKVIHCLGHLLSGCQDDSKLNDKDKQNGVGNPQQPCLVAIGEPIPHPSNIEIPLGKQTFLSKHSLDMKFTYADERIGEFLGYNPEDLIGRSVYEYYHALDSESVEKGLKSLFSKGQCETSSYRFLAKGGGYAWVLTQATVLYDSKGQRPSSVVCVNFVISGIECQNEVFSCSQLVGEDSDAKSSVGAIVDAPAEVSPAEEASTACAPPSAIKAEDEEDPEERLPRAAEPLLPPPPVAAPPAKASPVVVDLLGGSPDASARPAAVLFDGGVAVPAAPRKAGEGDAEVVEVGREKPVSPPLPSFPSRLLFPRPLATTSKIFVPRTEEMNKGFLMFSDDEPGLTMLKEEPEDLTHLAPTAGDVCVPLGGGPFLEDSMFDDIMLSDDYCVPLSMVPVPEDEDSDTVGGLADPVRGGRDEENHFLAYREDSSGSTSCSPSDHFISTSPLSSSECSSGIKSSSIPSLGSPELSGGGSLVGGVKDEDDDSLGGLTGSLHMGMVNSSDDEGGIRARYIPPIAEDLPLLVTTDLMWGASDQLVVVDVGEKIFVEDGATINREDLIGGCGVDGASASRGDAVSAIGLARKEKILKNSWSTNITDSKNLDTSSLAQLLRTETVSQQSQKMKSLPTNEDHNVVSKMGSRMNDHGGGLVDPNEILDQVYTRSSSSEKTMQWVSGGGTPPSAVSNSRKSRGGTGDGQHQQRHTSKRRPADNSSSASPAVLSQESSCKRPKGGSDESPPTLVGSQLLQQLITLNNGSEAIGKSAQTQDESTGWLNTGGGKGMMANGKTRNQVQINAKSAQSRTTAPAKTSLNALSASTGVQQQQHQVPPNMKDSVLMNLLGTATRKMNISSMESMNTLPMMSNHLHYIDSARSKEDIRRASFRKNSFSLLDPESTEIPSLIDLSRQDCEVNAPLGSASSLLQGRDLLTALEIPEVAME
ncbi:endothelial PAS domain-containing protein 1-like isoform X2 [Ischnura elegans]|uniref:endothelial PAS domain-containing protein 1-like isoform X2 n=1 Tax=Ischnura elegans TaxID=197161 RepID=UPI001ED8999D|nr:endothelial PAS domain-containing protein 1-like isoform X2 [Ischnura elegans]